MKLLDLVKETQVWSWFTWVGSFLISLSLKRHLWDEETQLASLGRLSSVFVNCLAEHLVHNRCSKTVGIFSLPITTSPWLVDAKQKSRIKYNLKYWHPRSCPFYMGRLVTMSNSVPHLENVLSTPPPPPATCNQDQIKPGKWKEKCSNHTGWGFLFLRCYSLLRLQDHGFP